MKFFSVCAVVAATVLALPALSEPSFGAKKKSTVRDRMSEEQKKKLRKMGYEHCKKKFGNVHSVEIKSDGRVFCYYVQ